MCIRDRLTGLEFASGIPGTVGGAVFMNAGAYDGEIKDVIEYADVIDSEGNTHRLIKDELELSYRHSVIAEKNMIVVGAMFNLNKGIKKNITCLLYTSSRKISLSRLSEKIYR